LKETKKLVTENNKILNKNEVLADTIARNFDLAIKGEITNNVNKNATIVNKALNSVYLALGDPAVNQALVSNGTISQEFSNLISIRNAAGTTVADKEMANELIKFGTSVEAQKAVVERLKAEAMNIHGALLDQNKELWKKIDPLEVDSQNPNRVAKLSAKDKEAFAKQLQDNRGMSMTQDAIDKEWNRYLAQ
jgi:glycine cleavage system H lipoate-binding protein